MQQFSFKHPIYHVLAQETLAVFPGVDKVWVLEKSTSAKQFRLYQTNRNQKSELIAMVNMETPSRLKTAYQYRWIGLDELPYNPQEKIVNQYSIFDEYKNRIIQLLLSDTDNDLVYLCYIFFNENHSQAGVHADGRLSTDNKQVIGATLYHLLTHRIQQHNKDQKIMKGLVYMQQRLIENQAKAEQNNPFVESFIQEHLEKSMIETGLEIGISAEAMAFLQEKKHTPNRLREVLEQAISWLLNFSSPNSNLVIEKSHVLSYTKASEKLKREPASGMLHSEKHQRTYDLLEKLEKAAANLLSNNIRLTGTNVGQSLETPISAPAITDALKKHAKKIGILIRLYPEKWGILKKHFKPMQNILDPVDEDHTDTLSA